MKPPLAGKRGPVTGGPPGHRGGHHTGALGGEAIAVEADVTDRGRLAPTFEAVGHALGGLDVLALDAAIDGARALACDAGPLERERVLRIDLLGSCLCASRTPIDRGPWGDPDGLRDLVAMIPLGRIGEPEEVARAAFLASDAASHATGCTVFVDGVMTDGPEFAQGG